LIGTQKVITDLAKTHTVYCKDEQVTALAVRALSEAILADYTGNSDGPQSLFISLHGDLGAGKTTATRYLLKAMGFSGKVKSPTYSLCEEYAINLPNSQVLHVYHFDLYRMQNPQEWVEAGLLEHFGQIEHPILALVEWPDNAGHTLPVMDLSITLAHPGSKEVELARTVHIQAKTPKGEAILRSLAALNT
jgi:tRNA threonylcarbamoyladenosine biosynthesis protein TsaE